MSKPENYFIREIIPLSHGGCVWLAEQFYETRQMETYYVNGVPQTNSKLFYHYGDVAAMYMDAEGALDTMVMIRKTKSARLRMPIYMGSPTMFARVH